MPAVARISGDASGLEAFSKKGQDAFHQLEEAGEHKLGRSLFRLTGKLAETKDIGDALALSMHALEKTFSLGMGATLGIAAGVALYEGFKKNIEAAEEMRKKTKEALEFSAPVKAGVASLQEVEAAYKKVVKQQEEVAKTYEHKNLLERAVMGFGIIGGKMAGASDEEISKALFAGQDQQANTLEIARVQLKKQALETAERETAILRHKQDGENEIVELLEVQLRYDREIAEAKELGFTALAKELRTQKEIAEQTLLAKQREEDMRRRAKLEDREANAERGATSNKGTETDRQLAALDIEIERKKKELEEYHSRKDLTHDKDINLSIQEAENKKARILEDQAKRTRASRDTLESAQDETGDTAQRQINELERKKAAAQRELEILRERGQLDEETANLLNAQVAQADKQLAEIKKQREGSLSDLDAEGRKLDLRGTKKEVQAGALQIDIDRLNEKIGSTDDELERRRLEVEKKRKENSLELLNQPELEEGKQSNVVAGRLTKIGGGGGVFQGGDPVAQRLDRSNHWLEQIHQALTGEKKGKRENSNFMLS